MSPGIIENGLSVKGQEQTFKVARYSGRQRVRPKDVGEAERNPASGKIDVSEELPYSALGKREGIDGLLPEGREEVTEPNYGPSESGAGRGQRLEVSVSPAVGSCARIPPSRFKDRLLFARRLSRLRHVRLLIRNVLSYRIRRLLK